MPQNQSERRQITEHIVYFSPHRLGVELSAADDRVRIRAPDAGDTARPPPQVPDSSSIARTPSTLASSVNSLVYESVSGHQDDAQCQ
jgi:hypothetical protein